MTNNTLAIDARLLLTHDTNIMRPEKLLPWTRTLAKSGYISDEKPIEEADEANERWVDETPEDMLVATIVCAWPTETEAVPTAMGDRIDTLLGKTRARKARTNKPEADDTVSGGGQPCGSHREDCKTRTGENAQRRAPSTRVDPQTGASVTQTPDMTLVDARGRKYLTEDERRTATPGRTSPRRATTARP